MPPFYMKMNNYKYEDLSETGRKQVDAYEYAIEDMYQIMDDFGTSFGESLVDQIRTDVLEEAFVYLKQVMTDCKQLLINDLMLKEMSEETDH